jgi:hypothetical protein
MEVPKKISIVIKKNYIPELIIEDNQDLDDLDLIDIGTKLMRANHELSKALNSMPIEERKARRLSGDPKYHSKQFKQKIISRSQAKSFDEAIKEWELLTVLENVGQYTTCICGVLIKNLYFIRNTVNFDQCIVGCECIKHVSGRAKYCYSKFRSALSSLERYIFKNQKTFKEHSFQTLFEWGILDAHSKPYGSLRFTDNPHHLQRIIAERYKEACPDKNASEENIIEE